MTRTQRACLCRAPLLLHPSLAAAESRAPTADLTGVAIDQSKAVLPGAVVTPTSTDIHLPRSTATDGAGRFALPALQPIRNAVSNRIRINRYRLFLDRPIRGAPWNSSA
jgi:hypothetical protein